jgi:hypothetical protein
MPSAGPKLFKLGQTYAGKKKRRSDIPWVDVSSDTEQKGKKRAFVNGNDPNHLPPNKRKRVQGMVNGNGSTPNGVHHSNGHVNGTNGHVNGESSKSSEKHHALQAQREKLPIAAGMFAVHPQVQRSKRSQAKTPLLRKSEKMKLSSYWERRVLERQHVNAKSFRSPNHIDF